MPMGGGVARRGEGGTVSRVHSLSAHGGIIGTHLPHLTGFGNPAVEREFAMREAALVKAAEVLSACPSRAPPSLVRASDVVPPHRPAPSGCSPREA